ncbi:Activating signal cointegrator 1 complex subunit 2 [Cichlidogyrus casuarinus]|uniref:Activating signal cointegrator 1 complex subunit 2 n=1 Tax=Cichlidogyrus casuarinus TaxID=1844966 RepID=A0ABD2QGB6_9PLAT
MIRFMFRLITPPSVNCLNAGFHKSLLYDHYLIDIPNLFDFCSVLEPLARTSCTNFLESLFSLQPKFLEDVALSFRLFKTVVTKSYIDELTNSDIQLIITIAVEKKSVEAKIAEYIDYLLDINSSMYYFLEICSGSSCFARILTICLEEKLLETLLSLYDSCIPLLQKMVENSSLPNSSVVAMLHKLSKAAGFIIVLVRKIFIEHNLNSFVEEVTSESTDISTIQRLSDDFIQFHLLFLNYRNFSLVYEILYPYREDAKLILDHYPKIGDLDTTSFHYINSAYEILLKETDDLHQKLSKMHIQATNKPSVADMLNKQVSIPKPLKKAIVAYPQFAAKIESIHDLVPDADPTMIAHVLDVYKGDLDRTINAFMDNELPAVVMADNNELVVADSECRDLASAMAAGLVKADRQTLWQGKRQTELKEAASDLDLKKKVRAAISRFEKEDSDDEPCNQRKDEMRGLILPHGMSKDEEIAVKLFQRLKSDELYEEDADDSFDVYIGKVEKNDSSGEGPSESVIEHYKGDENRRKNCLDIEDPAIVRERKNQAYRIGTVHNTRHHPQSNKNTSGPSTSTAAETESESANSMRRQHNLKDRNKAYVANHNRQKLANRKRQQR